MVTNKRIARKPITEAFVYQEINKLREEIAVRFEEKEKRDEERYHKLMDNLLWLVGSYKKHEEEVSVISRRQSNHEDRIENLEKAIFKSS